MNPTLNGHGGELSIAALGGFGIREMFTLSGGHIFPFYDAAVKAEWPIYDVRHEQTATFAAEGLARLLRRPGLAVLTAGPGVTNGVSAMTTALFNGSPLVVLGGRAPAVRWGSGSLQELDHVPIVAPVTKLAATVTGTDAIPKQLVEAVTVALTPHRGPVFVDFPLDAVFAVGTAEIPEASTPVGAEPDPDDVARAAALVANAERPAVIVGTDVWAGGAEDELRAFARELRVPVFMNGQGRGILPADDELAFSRTRGLLKGADVVVVVGTPLDFRLGFGRFGDAAVVHVVDDAASRAAHVTPAVSPAGDVRKVLAGMAAYTGTRADHEPWITRLRDEESARRAAEQAELEAEGDPVHPARIYGELRKVLDRDAIVIGDGGDFVSYAGKFVDSYTPGCWLDPGPYGCLGTGPGYAMAARVAHPDRQVVLLLGDGAFGFAGMDFDSLVRHRLPVVAIVGNNGIWGLEKHPMQQLYGYDVAADLDPDTGYDRIVQALGGAGETVRAAADLAPALQRAFASGVPYVVNVRTDPAVQYPRSSNLA